MVVLSIAVIFLILTLTFFGILMSSKNSDVVFPPVSTQCPDKWTADGSLCILPLKGELNAGNIYTGGTNCARAASFATTSDVGACAATQTDTNKRVMPNTTFINSTFGWANPSYWTVSGDLSLNFSDPAWGKQGPSVICQQKLWTKNNGISWSGVSNNTQCP